MIGNPDDRIPTLALSTKVEEDFVAPLTAVRSSLEILRDYRDLSESEHERFVGSALRGCAKLEQGIDHLAASIYAAGGPSRLVDRAPSIDANHQVYADRIQVRDSAELIDIDFSGFVFQGAETVNGFYDAIQQVVLATGKDWYFAIDITGCQVWPEAWIAFAHRGKKLNATCSKGTVRYITQAAEERGPEGLPGNTGAATSRDAAYAQIEDWKQRSEL